MPWRPWGGQPGPFANQPGDPLQPYEIAPPSPAEILTDWGKLVRGQPLGKSTVIAAGPSEVAAAPSATPMLQLSGDNNAALNFTVIVAPPQFKAITNAQLQGDIQALSGFSLIDSLPAGITVPDLAAIIEWGIGGQSQRVHVDILNGATVNLSGSYLRVFGQISYPYDVTLNVNTAIQLSAEVSRGWARGGGAQRTVYGFSQANAASDMFTIPPFAKRVRLTGYSSAGAGQFLARLQFFQGATGNIVGEYTFTTLATDWVPVPGAGLWASVTDASGSLTGWSAIFELGV